jgi:hypothetical protein
MTEISEHGTPTTSRPQGAGYLFGVPVGDLGWFASLLMGVTTGFAAFFAGTFVAIISMLIYSSTTHQVVDYALTYRRVGLPIGVVVMAISLAYLGTLWARRQIRKA